MRRARWLPVLLLAFAASAARADDCFGDRAQVRSAAGVFAAADALVFAIGPGISGAWYDPAQTGHGLLIEVLPGNRFYAAWFSFSPDGTRQAWFAGVGTYCPGSNTATITDVEMPVGGHWIPHFNLTPIVPLAWGTLSFTFNDCNQGRVDFASPLGYGSGSMNLTRLTQPAGLTCP